MTGRAIIRPLAGTAAATLAVGLLTAPLGGPASSHQAANSDSADRPSRSVGIALKGAGYGSRAVGGQVPTESDKTAWMVIGCATRVPIDRENHEAEVTLPDLGKASNVKTEVWTRKEGDRVSSYTRNTIAKVVVAQTDLGSVEIQGISSFAHAWHDSLGFDSEARTKVASIAFVPPGGGEPQELEIPTPGQPLEVPGLVRISIGSTQERANADGSTAQANALIIDRIPSDTRAKISQAKAQALAGVKHGTFHGFAAATEAEALTGTVTSGRTPLNLMPCQGTDGKVITKEATDSDLGGQLLATGLKVETMGKQLKDKSTGFERATVAHVNLGDGQLDIAGIIGQANVTREGNKLTANIKGSTVGTIVANGEQQEFPDTGVLEIPGVAKLERFVVERSKAGIHVIALRITLLDGDGAVINLGQAKMQIVRN
jgi:hypothetical protein